MKRKGEFIWRMVVGVMFINSSAFAQVPSTKALPKGKAGAAADQQVPSAPGGVSPSSQAGVPPPIAGAAAVNAIKIEQLSSKAQFKALSDDTLLDIGGRKIRKGDFVAEFNRRAAAGPAAAAAVRPSGLAAIQARLTAEENAAIAASDVEVRRRMAEIRAKGGDR